MIIRPVEAADVSSLARLIHDYITIFYDYPDPGGESIQYLIEQLLAHPQLGQQFVAIQADQPVGFATLYFTFSTLQAQRVAILNDLYVKPDTRRGHVGEALFSRCRRHVQSLGMIRMEWQTAPDNTAAQALYEKLGSRRVNMLLYEIDGAVTRLPPV